MAKHKKKSHFLTKITPTQQVFLALGLFFVAVTLSRGDEMSALEETIFLSIYGWPDFLRVPFLIITQLGSVLILMILFLLYLVQKKYHKVLRVLLVGALAYLLTGLAKDIWGRARPNELIEGIVNLDYVRGPGFPSGHTALAVALALTVAHFLPKKYQWIVLAWIVAVGLSRIYLGVHAPLDIVGGFAIGWLAYALFRHVRISNITRGKRKTKLITIAREE